MGKVINNLYHEPIGGKKGGKGKKGKKVFPSTKIIGERKEREKGKGYHCQ